MNFSLEYTRSAPALMATSPGALRQLTLELATTRSGDTATVDVPAVNYYSYIFEENKQRDLS